MAALAAALAGLTAAPAGAEPPGYVAATWLAAAPAEQRLALAGVIHGWSELAVEVEAAWASGWPLSPRQAETWRLAECVAGKQPRPLDDLRARVTAFATAAPDRSFASLRDLAATALGEMCPGR